MIDAAKGAHVLFLLSSATNFTPILGAFLADTYVGRYRMIGFGCMASLLVIFLFLSKVYFFLLFEITVA